MSERCVYCGHDADLQLNIATGCSEGVYECRDVYHCRFRMVDKVERLKAELERYNGISALKGRWVPISTDSCHEPVCLSHYGLNGVCDCGGAK